MVKLLFDFHAAGYHATPWGNHVNEGLVEWPPSPWRIIRALLATGYAKLGWQEPPIGMRRLVDALASAAPSYRLPHASSAHTRHYMPVAGWKSGVPKTSLVLDAFVKPHGALVVEWPVVLQGVERELLGQLLDRLTYLGRAESRVHASLVSETRETPPLLVSTERKGFDDEPVRLLAPVTRDEYDRWRSGSGAGPEDLLAAIQIDTNRLQEEGWNMPPGARELVYWRPVDALSRTWLAAPSGTGEKERNHAALFALSTDKKRDVLPLMERALPTMASFRTALLIGCGNEQQRAKSPELTGKDDLERPLRHGHEHVHFIPLSLGKASPTRIDHVLAHAPMGYGPTAERALRRLRSTWAKGISDIGVTLVGIGKLDAFRKVGGSAVPALGRSTVWVTQTPFVPPRFLKTRGKDSLAAQLREEADRRGLPGFSTPPVIGSPKGEGAAARTARWFRRFARTRQGDNGNHPMSVYHVTLTFDRPVEGPICLGWGCHFGLGVFEPAEARTNAEGGA